MPDTRTVEKIFKWKPLTKRSQGRPKYTWEDNIKQDICQMKIKNWIACVQDRAKWKDVVVKAKISTIKGSSVPRRRTLDMDNRFLGTHQSWAGSGQWSSGWIT